MIESYPGEVEISVPESAHNRSMKTIICQLWNFKTLTLDLANYSRKSAYEDDFLFELKDLICGKLASMLKMPVQSVPGDLFRLVQCGKNLT